LAAITYLTTNTQSLTWLTMSDAIKWKIDAKSFAFTQDQWLWAAAKMDLRNRHPNQLHGKRIDKPGHFPLSRLAPHRLARSPKTRQRRTLP